MAAACSLESLMHQRLVLLQRMEQQQQAISELIHARLKKTRQANEEKLPWVYVPLLNQRGFTLTSCNCII